MKKDKKKNKKKKDNLKEKKYFINEKTPYVDNQGSSFVHNIRNSSNY